MNQNCTLRALSNNPNEACRKPKQIIQLEKTVKDSTEMLGSPFNIFTLTSKEYSISVAQNYFLSLFLQG